MSARDEEINELLSTVGRLSEMAARNRLRFATHLLDMLQLELTMVMFGYSDVDDDRGADPKSAKPAEKANPARRRSARARRA